MKNKIYMIVFLLFVGYTVQAQITSFPDGDSGGGNTTKYYFDSDGDGYGNPNSSYVTSPQSRYVANNTDCNDSDRNVYPGAPEICDGKDNDCNGSVDESPKPSTPSMPSITVNCGNTRLTRGNPPSGITWYWQTSASGTSTANISTTIMRTSGTRYYLRGRNNSTGCWGPTRTVNYTIKYIPGIPSTPSVVKNCGNTRLTRSNPPSGITWYWQSSATGTSTSNASSTLTRTSGTRYYLRARNNTTGCWGSARTVNYSINYIPSVPSTPSVTKNCGNTKLTRSNPPSGITWYWQSSASGTSTSNASTTLTRTSGTTYYLRARNNNSGCWSSARTVSYTINYIPSVPAVPSVANNCGNTKLTRSNPPSGITWYWQSSASGTSTSNASSVLTRTSGSTYYLRARNNSSGCWSSARTISYSVKYIPGIPSAPSVTTNCGNTKLTRGNPPSGTTWYWQSSASGTSTSNASSVLTRTSGSTYYLRARNNSSGCWGSARTVSYSINSVPSIPTAPSIAINCGNTKLTRSNPPSGITWYWQSSASGTSTSDTSTILTRTDGTVYYLRARNNGSGCWSSARTVNYNVNHPVLWYADTDNDGLGDPNSTINACTQPTGYVRDNTDQCPDEYGTIQGCPSSLHQLTVSDTQNYVLSRTYLEEMTSPSEIRFNKDVAETVTYMDGLGRPKQQIAINASVTSVQKTVANELTIDWTQGQGGTPFFNQNGSTAENSRTIGVDPTGKSSLVWYCDNDSGNDADGGWNTDYITVDKNIGYRYTVWVKRTGSNDGHSYHGTQNVNNLNGSANSNPYFWYGDVPQLDTWYLLVGVIHPYQYTGTNSGITGVYDQSGNKVIDGTDFKWMSSTTTSRFRSYLYYSTDANTKQFFWNPVVQKLDGTENSIAELVTAQEEKTMDIITHIEYDELGRQTKQYLPFAKANTGAYTAVDINNDINSYYLNTYANDFPGITNPAQVNAYSESIYEASPLNRVLEQGAPGLAWKADPNSDADHTIKFDWRHNTANEVVRFDVTFADANNTEVPSLEKDGFYAANELTVSITKDENWTTADGDNHTTREYTDKQGRVLLKRTFNESIPHDTYYVYDSYGNLTYVVPPKVTTTDGVSNTELAELCYQYRYDYRNRLIEKKIPGKGWEYIVYNKLDQPVMTQDANLKVQGKWLFTKYDAIGRVTYTGIITNTSGRIAMQDSADNTTVYKQYETKQSSATTIAGTTIYYSNDAIPQGITEIHTINYYDDYVFDRPGISAPPIVLGQNVDVNAKSLPTGSKVKVLGTDKWITTVTWYDQKGRPIYVASKNEYLNTTDVIESELDFAGRIQQTKATHTKGSNAAIVTIDKFTYDHTGRVTKQTQKINDQDKELIASNNYDELGQLVSKNVGGIATQSPAQGLQTVDYTYNIRGWLQGINDVDAIGSDLFSFAIDYNSGANPLYNGNISKTSWQTANDNVTRSYTYTYDALNRIKTGISNDDKYNLSNVSYDKMGNILSLNRKGHTNTGATTFGDMDILSYAYDSGNKLLRVGDTGNDNYGFKDGINTNDDFVYDDNGNMTIDRNKGITGITYNHLNLPTTVSISNSQGTGTISYIYDATGAKLKKIVTEGSSLINTEYAGNYIYKNGNLEFFNHPEGIVEKEADGYKYVYQFKDHLNNVRLSYKDADQNGSISQSEIVQEKNYYPFGLTHKGYNNTLRGRNHTYGFTNKEEQDEIGLNWIDITARNYAPAIGRWMNIDPLAELMRRHSPYNYAFNNPIFFLDPDGMMACPNGDCPDPPENNGPVDQVVNTAVAVWDYFTSSEVSTSEKTKTASDAIVPDKLAVSFIDGISKALSLDNVQVNVDYDKNFVKELVGEIFSIIPFLASESTVVNVEQKTTKLYRGVNSESVAYKNAQKGTAKPRGGDATPLEHNTLTTESQYTSWTWDKRVAKNYALRTNGEGVILEANIPINKTVVSPNTKSVNLIQSPGTIVSESELLVKGTTKGAKVEKVVN